MGGAGVPPPPRDLCPSQSYPPWGEARGVHDLTVIFGDLKVVQIIAR